MKMLILKEIEVYLHTILHKITGFDGRDVVSNAACSNDHAAESHTQWLSNAPLFITERLYIQLCQVARNASEYSFLLRFC
jgi:hypothetical protein